MTDQTTSSEPIGPPDGWREIGTRLSNFDHSIDPGTESVLREGGVYARHAGQEFNGEVWFQDGQFHEQVWRFHAPMRTHSADTLEALMRDVNDEWGWD